MGQILSDDIWMRRGISLLWDAKSLANVCMVKHVVSLRQFLILHETGWPEAAYVPLLVNDGKALLVAGLESAIDALPPTEACEWLEQMVYKALVSFQREVADGGGQAAIILWLTEHKRLTYQTSDDTYYWICGTEYKGQKIPLSRCLFVGAQQDLQPIHVRDDKNNQQCIGLFHPRIS